MELDVSPGQNVVSARIGKAWADHLNHERITTLAWFVVVSDLDGPGDLTGCLVGRRRATNQTGPGWLARWIDEGGAIWKAAEEVSRDVGPVNVQVCAVIDVLQMTPQRVSVSSCLARATDAEIRLGVVDDDVSAARHEVARNLGTG
jgi:hypothetical protein